MGKIRHNSSISKGEREKISLGKVNKKSFEVNLNNMEMSSFGGLAILRKEEEHLSLSNKLASCINDTRSQYLVHHTLEEIIMTRVFQICLGYKDVNDCDRNRMEPMMRLVIGDDYDKEICSSATMCRFENMVTDEDLANIQRMFVTIFILSYNGKAPSHIILDCDDTNVDTYGCQEQTLFNNYYGGYCYMPLLIFEGYSGKMILPLLRPGRRNKTANISDTLKWLIGCIRAAWPGTIITVRGDSHFCSHEFMDWAMDPSVKKVFFITGLGANSVLSSHPVTKRLTEEVKRSYGAGKKPVKLYGRISYKAGTWLFPERVIVKVEITQKGELNIRYIVTNIYNMTDANLYERMYCNRGKDELYIKEFKEAVNGDRMSCHTFKANKLRIFIHAAAYVLMHSIRERALCNTKLERATLLTIRERLLLTAVSVRVMKSKVTLDFAMYNPMADELRHALLFYQLTA